VPYSYNKLRGRIVEKFGSQEKFAIYIGISSTSLSKKMTGATCISQKDIDKWSELLDIDKKDYGIYFFS
jgi:hypothetical protein